jgi:hypothetical protein
LIQPAVFPKWAGLLKKTAVLRSPAPEKFRSGRFFPKKGPDILKISRLLVRESGKKGLSGGLISRFFEAVQPFVREKKGKIWEKKRGLGKNKCQQMLKAGKGIF